MPSDTIRWVGDENGHAELIDQTRLPLECEYITCRTIERMWEAIRVLSIRGAPALGIAAAMGLVLGIKDSRAETSAGLLEDIQKQKQYLETSRPTAVNLFWALERMERVARENRHLPVAALRRRLLDEALAMQEEDRRICRAIGKNGAELLHHGDCVLTHCNAGALATADYGTALAVVYRANEEGKRVSVIAGETRPLLQGARLTAWELKESAIPVTLICDNMAARVMHEKRVDAVVVGADRIASNGDTANKIGTYGLSVLAMWHRVPFYVAAPISTFDMQAADGDAIPIEQRGREEVACWGGHTVAPPEVDVYNPAFDITPAGNITAIITEKGVASAPDRAKMASLHAGPDSSQNNTKTSQ